MSRLIVTSASGSNGDGYGTVLAFTPEGELMGRFSDDDRISDPRGVRRDQSALGAASNAHAGRHRRRGAHARPR